MRKLNGGNFGVVPTMSQVRDYLSVLLLLALLAVAAVYAPRFLLPSTLLSVVCSAAILLPAVLGMQTLLIAGRFDLASGATAALAGVVTGVMLLRGQPVWVAIAGGMLAGAAVGVATAALTTLFRIDGLIASLALMGIVRSIALVVADGRTLSEFPPSLQAETLGTPGDDSRLLAMSACLLLIGTWVFRYHLASRRLYALGSSEPAARAVGLPVRGLIVYAYALSAIGGACTGIIQAARSMSASPLSFQDLPLECIAACIIGGGTLKGGRGSMIGAAFGLILVVSTRNLVVAMDVPLYWRYLVVGMFLLIAAAADVSAKRSVTK